MILRFRKTDTNVKISFDLFSYIEIDAVLGLTVIALLSRTDTVQGFTVGLILVAMALNILHLFRVIIAGDNRILIGINDYDLDQIKGMNASLVTLHVFIKGGKKMHIVVPLTKNETIRKMKYIK